MDGLGTIPACMAGSRFVHIFSGPFQGYLYTEMSLVRVDLPGGEGRFERVGGLRSRRSAFPFLDFHALPGLPGTQFWAASVLFTVFVYI